MDAMPQSNSHTSQGPGADEDILHFCRRMGYVPAGTPIPTGSRIQPFLKLKPVRGLDLNRCSTAHPWHPNNKGNSNWYALLTQVSGRIAPHPCTKCARGAARWTPCVVPSTPDTWSLVNGACACCLYSNQGANCSFVKGKIPRTTPYVRSYLPQICLDARQVPDIDNTTLAPHTSFFPPEAARAAPEVNTVANLANPALAAHPATRPTTAVRASPVTSSPWAGNTLLESHTPRATTAAAVLNAHPRPSVFLPPISSFDLKPPGTLTPSPVPAYNMSRLDDFGAPDAFPNTSLDASYGPTAFPIPKPDPFGHINTAYGPRPDFRSGPTVGHGVNASSGAAGRFGGSWSGPAPHGAFNKENEIYPTTGRDAICTARPPPVPGRTPSFGTRYALASKPTFEPVPSFGHEMGPYDSKTAAGPGRMHHPLLPYDGSHRHVAERGRVLADRDQWEEDQRDEIMHDVCINSAKLAELAAEQCRLVTKLQFVGKARRC
ncbi:hypothetical protein GE09DRAFT_586748 [Coniochaeta sp. 2T2.1]|nr:hypothetical protein GE09DRAFT_586748 [Coniochaeta sp. 2T2.1]